MTLQTLCVRGYRSIKHVYLPLQRINVIVGANGSGKTNLYRAMYVLQLWITKHSTALADMIASDSGCNPIQLEKTDGETRIQGQSALERAMTL